MSSTPESNAGEQQPTRSDVLREQTAAAYEALKQREGRMNAIEPQYDRMQEDIKAAVSAIVPGLEWSMTRPRGETSCGEPYSDTPGHDVKLIPYGSDSPIPGELWPAVAEAVNAIAVANGFDEGDLSRPDGDFRQLGLTEPNGGSITLESGGRTALLIMTGCYLSGA